MRKINFKILILLCLSVLSLDTASSMKKNNESKDGKSQTKRSVEKKVSKKSRKRKKRKKKGPHVRTKTGSWGEFNRLLDDVLENSKNLSDDILFGSEKTKNNEKIEKQKAIARLRLNISPGNLNNFISLLKVAPVDNISEIINETTEPSGDSFLHIATRNNSEEIVKYLLEKTDLDINIVNAKGETAYQIACEKSNYQIGCLIFKKFITYQGEMSEDILRSYLVKPN